MLKRQFRLIDQHVTGRPSLTTVLEWSTLRCGAYLKAARYESLQRVADVVSRRRKLEGHRLKARHDLGFLGDRRLPRVKPHPAASTNDWLDDMNVYTYGVHIIGGHP